MTLSVEAAHEGVVVAGNSIGAGGGLCATGCRQRRGNHGFCRSGSNCHNYFRPFAISKRIHRSFHDDYGDHSHDDHGAGATPI